MNQLIFLHGMFQLSEVNCGNCQTTMKGSEFKFELIEVSGPIYAYICPKCGHRGLLDGFFKTTGLLMFPYEKSN